MNVKSTRRTKIIWSFESKVLTRELASDIVKEDFDCLRLVYQSGSGQTIVDFLDALDKARAPGKIISIMIDVQTPVRGTVSPNYEANELKYGQSVVLSKGTSKQGIPCDVSEWNSFFKEGSTVYFGYGNVCLQTKRVTADSVEAEVIQGGAVYPAMDIHVPSTRPEPVLSKIDLSDLKKVLKKTVDYFVLPGFIAAEDLLKMRDFVTEHTASNPWFILKVNSDKVYENLPHLLKHVQGVLVSRLEMALFMEPAIIPVVTKEIIQTCNIAAKIVFTASEMLGSMRHNPTPTRAEVSDVANSVTDGADAVVLTEDVSYGRHGARAISLMAKIIEDMETKHNLAMNWERQEPTEDIEMDVVSFTAYQTAKRVGAKALVCLTKEGNTAVKLASFRTTIPIIAVTFSPEVLRRLSLVRGVTAVLSKADPLIDQVLPVVNDLLKSAAWLKKDDRIVFVSVTLSPLGRTESNLFTVQTVM